MRVAGGEFTITGPLGVTKGDTFTCQHCGKKVDVHPGKKLDDLGGYCRHCWNSKNPLSGLICSNCVDALAKNGGVCFPFQKLIQDSTMKELERRRLRAGALKCW